MRFETCNRLAAAGHKSMQHATERTAAHTHDGVETYGDAHALTESIGFVFPVFSCIDDPSLGPPKASRALLQLQSQIGFPRLGGSADRGLALLVKRWIVLYAQRGEALRKLENLRQPVRLRRLQVGGG